MTLIDKYLQLAKTYKDKYGDNTILLMQVGSFYEMYAKKNKDNYTNIIAFKNITDYVISEKKPGVLMAGGPDSQIDRLIVFSQIDRWKGFSQIDRWIGNPTNGKKPRKYFLSWEMDRNLNYT